MSQVASLVAVLKVARQLNLVRDLDTVAVPGHDPVHIPEALLQRAVEHGRDTLLVDAMALACSHPKSTAIPGALLSLPGLPSLPGLALSLGFLALRGPRHDSGGQLRLPLTALVSSTSAARHCAVTVP